MAKKFSLHQRKDLLSWIEMHIIEPVEKILLDAQRARIRLIQQIQEKKDE